VRVCKYGFCNVCVCVCVGSVMCVCMCGFFIVFVACIYRFFSVFVCAFVCVCVGMDL